MTIEEKRDALKEFCDGRSCWNCPLEVGYSCNFDDCKDAQIIATMYAIAFSEKSTPVKNDVVNHPSHYTKGGVECIDAMEAAFGIEFVQHFCACNAFKYVFRHLNKNGLEDIEKAKWYLNKYLALEEKKNA